MDFRYLPASTFTEGRRYRINLENGTQLTGTYFDTQYFDSDNGFLVFETTNITRHIFTNPNSTPPGFLLNNQDNFSIENFIRDPGSRVLYPVTNVHPALFHVRYKGVDYPIRDISIIPELGGSRRRRRKRRTRRH